MTENDFGYITKFAWQKQAADPLDEPHEELAYSVQPVTLVQAQSSSPRNQFVQTTPFAMRLVIPDPTITVS